MIPILVSACGSTSIFYATFEADTIESPPSENPPEDPPGDLIWTTAGPGYLNHTLSVVNDTKLSSKSLKYANINAPDFNRFVGFVSKEVSLDFGKTFYAYWSGHINLDNTSTGLHIWLGDAHLKAIAALEFKDGTVRLQTSEGETPTYEAVGTYANDEIHFVIMQVGKSCRCYKISIFQSGGGAIDTGIQRVLNQDALNTQRPTLYLLYFENTSGPGAYVFDNVTISENVTWYRPWKPQPLQAMFEK